MILITSSVRPIDNAYGRFTNSFNGTHRRSGKQHSVDMSGGDA